MGKGNLGPNCSGDDEHFYGSRCAKVGRIRKLLQNWEFRAFETREEQAKMTSHRHSADAASHNNKRFYQGVSFHILRGKYPFFGFAIAAWCVLVLTEPQRHDFQQSHHQFREERE